MGLLFLILGLILVTLGLIALVRGRLERVRIQSRIQALIVLAAAALAFAASVAMNPYVPQS